MIRELNQCYDKRLRKIRYLPDSKIKNFEVQTKPFLVFSCFKSVGMALKWLRLLISKNI